MAEETLDETTIEQIARFKQAVQAPEDASDEDEEFMGPAYSNRGRKLKRDAREVYQGKLTLGPSEGYGVKVVQMGGKKRPVIYKKRKAEVLDDDEEDYENSGMPASSDIEVDPYEKIKLGDLLAPISHPSELPNHAAISETYKSEAIRKLSSRALDIICEEQKHAVQFSKLMSIFLGDDPSYARSNKMNLPAYEHLSTENVVNGGSIENNDTIEGENDNDASPDYRRVTRNQTSQELDPFFALPQINIDRDFGLSKESAEESRQLAQIALQRSEEFIRCMTNVRMGLLKADRHKSMVYSWCKEMAKQQEEEEAAATAAAAAGSDIEEGESVTSEYLENGM